MRITAATWVRRATAFAGLTLAVACGGDAQDPAQTEAPGFEPAPVADGENSPPEVRSLRIDPSEPALGGNVRVIANASDPDGDPVHLRYRWLIDGRSVPGEEREIPLVGASKGSSVEVLVTPSDGKVEGETARAEVTVIDRPPTLTDVGIDPSSKVPPGDPVTAVARAHDPDGDRVTYEYTWYVNDEPVSGRGNLFRTDGLAQGDRIRVAVVASDGAHRSAPLQSIEVTVGSAHPEITSTPPGMEAGGVFRYPIVAKDPDGDRRLRYRLSEAPEGMRIDEIYGEVLWKPRRDQAGVHPVAVTVTDSTGLATTQKFSITVSTSEAAPASPEAN
ncbi:MAG TPA: putative Ig domain-containing protein [Myxococcota bacterium]